MVLVFLGATFFVVYNFFILPKKNTEQLKEEAGGNTKSLSVDSLITRTFKTEQTDILNDSRFQSLVDNSVAMTPLDKLEPGKDNPFEAGE